MRAHRSTEESTEKHRYESTHMESYRKNAGPQFRGARFVRACAVEMHMDISEEPFYAVIYRNNAGPVCRARHAHLD